MLAFQPKPPAIFTPPARRSQATVPTGGLSRYRCLGCGHRHHLGEDRDPCERGDCRCLGSLLLVPGCLRCQSPPRLRADGPCACPSRSALGAPGRRQSRDSHVVSLWGTPRARSPRGRFPAALRAVHRPHELLPHNPFSCSTGTRGRQGRCSFCWSAAVADGIDAATRRFSLCAAHVATSEVWSRVPLGGGCATCVSTGGHR